MKQTKCSKDNKLITQIATVVNRDSVVGRYEKLIKIVFKLLRIELALTFEAGQTFLNDPGRGPHLRADQGTHQEEPGLQDQSLQ